MQYSVFECLLDEAGQKKMRQKVMKVIRPRKDQVRFYSICAECLKQVEITSGVEVLSAEPAAVIAG